MSIFLVFIIFIIPGIWSFTDHNSRIIGGHDTEVSLHPYQVSLQYYRLHNCAGSIISDRWILSAGHCTDNIDIKFTSILAGITNLWERGQRIHVGVMYTHPNFSQTTMDYDIALLYLEKALVFGPKVQPVILPSIGFDPSDGTDVVVTGWGTTVEGGWESDILQEITIPVVGRDKCNELYNSAPPPYNRPVTDRMMCAGTLEGGKDHCHGDSGGPIVANGIQVGITSWANGCAKPNYPGVNVNVGMLREFIKNTSGI